MHLRVVGGKAHVGRSGALPVAHFEFADWLAGILLGGSLACMVMCADSGQWSTISTENTLGTSKHTQECTDTVVNPAHMFL